MDIVLEAEARACYEATTLQDDLMAYLGEDPERWRGAMAVLLTVSGEELMLAETGLNDTIGRAALTGLVMLHLFKHIADTPVGRRVIEDFQKEYPDGPE